MEEMSKLWSALQSKMPPQARHTARPWCSSSRSAPTCVAVAGAQTIAGTWSPFALLRIDRLLSSGEPDRYRCWVDAPILSRISPGVLEGRADAAANGTLGAHWCDTHFAAGRRLTLCATRAWSSRCRRICQPACSAPGGRAANNSWESPRVPHLSTLALNLGALRAASDDFGTPA